MSTHSQGPNQQATPAVIASTPAASAKITKKLKPVAMSTVARRKRTGWFSRALLFFFSIGTLILFFVYRYFREDIYAFFAMLAQNDVVKSVFLGEGLSYGLLLIPVSLFVGFLYTFKNLRQHFSDFNSTFLIPILTFIGTIIVTYILTQQQITIADTQAKNEVMSSYFETINNLILQENLLTSKEGDKVRIIAQTTTIATLGELDGRRKGSVILFLYKTKLLQLTPNATDNKKTSIISLAGADLSAVELEGANLSNANFAESNLMHAKLKHADFTGADFTNANLSDADLQAARLISAVFNNADLSSADIHDADITNTSFYLANLSNVRDFDMLTTKQKNEVLEPKSK